MKQQLPGILSDRQIRELCVPPNFSISERLPRELSNPNNAFSSFTPLTERVSFTHMTEEEIRQKLVADQYDVSGLFAYRPLTDEEKAVFKPMISPFVPNQVRARRRRPSAQELRDFNLAHQNFLGHPEYNPNYALPEGAIVDSHEGLLMAEDEKIISYGLTSYGYDVRCGNEFKIFTNINSTVVDPKNFDKKNFVPFKGDVCIIPPNSFVLARTLERFDLPRDVVADCVGKSTYARCGISIMVTPLEPEWDGYLTLEFANTTPLPAKLYAGEGCGQIRFFRGSEPCEVSYRDRGGKYMDQGPSPTTPKL